MRPCVLVALLALTPCLAFAQKPEPPALGLQRLKEGDVGRLDPAEFRVVKLYDSPRLLLASPNKRGLSRLVFMVEHPTKGIAEDSLITLSGEWKVSGPIRDDKAGRSFFCLAPVKPPAKQPVKPLPRRR